MDAIEEFVSGGGIFTLATGRSIAATLPAVKEIGLKFPAIVNNGATAYDYATDEIIFSEDLDDSAYGIVEGLMERFPDCGIEVTAVTTEAQAAGLQVKDLIIGVRGKRIAGENHFSRLLDQEQDRWIEVLRDGVIIRIDLPADTGFSGKMTAGIFFSGIG